MSEVLGREIRAERLDPAKAGAGGVQTADGLMKMLDWYDNHGLLGNALTLRAILGREPRTLRAFVEELALNSLVAA
jgi:hypothetical protein